MYTIVEIQGHQHKVKAGDIVDVDRLDAELGQELTFDQVLFVGGEQGYTVGKPTVSGAVVKAKVIKIDRDKKIWIVKKKPGKYTKKRGFRRSYTGLLVTEITDGSGQRSEIDKTSKRAEKYLK